MFLREEALATGVGVLAALLLFVGVLKLADAIGVDLAIPVKATDAEVTGPADPARPESPAEPPPVQPFNDELETPPLIPPEDGE